MITIKQQVPPPNGWAYMEDGIETKAPSYGELIQKVLIWKLQNRKNVHNVQNEVNDYISRISPQSVLVRKPTQAHMQRREVTLADKVYNFACRVYDQFSPDKVSSTPAEAERRARVCAECPYNQKYNFSCGACEAETERLLKAVRAGRVNSSERRINACERLGYHLSTAVWLENDQLGELSDDPHLPRTCWRKKQ
jgi:hypothetical protein